MFSSRAFILLLLIFLFLIALPVYLVLSVEIEPLKVSEWKVEVEARLLEGFWSERKPLLDTYVELTMGEALLVDLQMKEVFFQPTLKFL